MDEVSGGRVRRAKREEVRARLLDSAFSIFIERGYEGASLEKVAEEAGFSKGAVYSNFASKDELFFALVASRIDERIEKLRLTAISQAEAPANSPGKAQPSKTKTAHSLLGTEVTQVSMAARKAGSTLGALGEADPGWQKLFIEFWLRCARNEDLRLRLAEKRRQMRTKIAENFKEEVRASGYSLEDAEAMDLATAVLALSNGLGIEGIIDPDSARPELFGELFSRILTNRASR